MPENSAGTLHNQMKSIEPELNFTDEFTLSRNGIAKEIEADFDTIRLCLDLRGRYPDKREVFNRIIAMPLRKLLCERTGDSALERLCPGFKMFPLDGHDSNLQNNLHVIRPPLGFQKESTWLPLEAWKKQIVAYFSRTENDFSGWLTSYAYNGIRNNLKGRDKTDFESYMQSEVALVGDEPSNGYGLKDNTPEGRARTYALMEKAGYNQLTIYDFIKHLADKKSAHIDQAVSILVSIVDKPGQGDFNLLECIGLQLIIAAKKQIPELNDYWPQAEDPTEEE
jgi:hypothetical protein